MSSNKGMYTLLNSLMVAILKQVCKLISLWRIREDFVTSVADLGDVR